MALGRCARRLATMALRFEFQVDLKPIRRLKKPKPQREFALRQKLVLAYQIQDLLDQGKAKSLLQIGQWIGTCHSRMSQIINLLNLAPAIQQEILLVDDPKIHYVTEFHIRDIAMEVCWQNQKDAWQALLNNLSKNSINTF